MMFSLPEELEEGLEGAWVEELAECQVKDGDTMR